MLHLSPALSSFNSARHYFSLEKKISPTLLTVFVPFLVHHNPTTDVKTTHSSCQAVVAPQINHGWAQAIDKKRTLDKI